MEEEKRRLSRLQRIVANDVVIQRYDFLVGCVDAIRIFPYLVASRVVQQEYRQYLDGERTDKDKMMALLRELTRSPLENWFNEFIGALSQISQYHAVAEILVEGSQLKGVKTACIIMRVGHPPAHKHVHTCTQ